MTKSKKVVMEHQPDLFQQKPLLTTEEASTFITGSPSARKELVRKLKQSGYIAAEVRRQVRILIQMSSERFKEVDRNIDNAFAGVRQKITSRMRHGAPDYTVKAG